MRKREKDPYFAIFLMLVPLLIVWLGLAGPLFEDAAANGVISTIRGWQTLIAAFIAIGAACVAWWNTTRQLRHAAELERTRRSRKRAALRAVLPLALSDITGYTRQTGEFIRTLLQQAAASSGPSRLLREDLPSIPEPPSDTITAIADFIEYSDALDVELFEEVLSRIQVHNARLETMAGRVRVLRARLAIDRNNAENYLLDAALIYAGAAKVFEYARRETEDFPKSIDWDDVRNALPALELRDDRFPRIFELINRREQRGATPFHRYPRRSEPERVS